MNNHAHDQVAREQNSTDVFARLHGQDVEQFYAHYQLWGLRRRVPLIEKQVETLREHLAENQQSLEALRPSALAQAVLVRLQSCGVNDPDVLDLMLDRGEDWLDRMMQRLDYCEQVEDFIQGDYIQWCVKSLEGAYDWIDSLLGSLKENNGLPESGDDEGGTTEALILQKLSLEDEEVTPGATLAQPALEPAAQSSELDAETAATSESAPILGSVTQEQLAGDQDSGEPELLGWKDLEDLEAPESLPVPWYSVDLPEDGSSSHGSKQLDWIAVLQADNATQPESGASSIAGDAATLAASSEQAETHTLAPADSELTQAQPVLPAEEVPNAELSTTAAAELEVTATEQEVQEPAQAEGSTVEEITRIASEASPPVIFVEEIVVTAHEQAEDTALTVASEQLDEQADSSALAVVGEQPGEQADSAALATAEAGPETEQEQAREESELESATALNDISGIEGEQEEQLAWYEYLNLEEPAPSATQSEIVEQHAQEALGAEEQTAGATEMLASEKIVGETEMLANEEVNGATETPEIYAYAIREEATGEPTELSSQESTLAEEAGEIEGWQTWQGQEADDETVPLVLKEIQNEQQAPASSAQAEAAVAQSAIPLTAMESAVENDDETPTAAIESAVQDVDKQEEAAGEKASESIPEGTNVVSASLAEAGEADALGQVGAHVEMAPASSEASTLVASSEREESRQELVVAQFAGPARTEETPLAQAPVEVVPPPKKLGFWRRLFRFGRRKKRASKS